MVLEMNIVWFEEDDFFSRTDEELEDLMKMYKKISLKKSDMS
tara:strand:+ start:276 stop:401 length:126 start_codon:yes stop_codon:yes gene_type:complete